MEAVQRKEQTRVKEAVSRVEDSVVNGSQEEGVHGEQQ